MPATDETAPRPQATGPGTEQAAAKKLIDAPGHVVEDLITGLVSSSCALARVEGHPVIVRSRPGSRRVRLISGGGSGHEPAHAGYVGEGMLDAAVLGPVFTSPPADAVQAAISAVHPGGEGETLLIVKNYTGDRLNFGLAAQLAQAQGHRTDLVIVADDVGLGDSSRAGRRGIGGTVLVHKLAGALADSGAGLAAIKAAVERFLTGLGTMGVALGPCHSPGATGPNFVLGPGEIEWGLGIHGEAGHERGTIVTASQVAARLVAAVRADRGIGAGDQVAVLVNGLGSTPPMELEIVTGAVLRQLAAAGITARRCWTGTFLTSLDMPGVSVSLARVDEEQLALLDAPAATTAWVPGRSVPATAATVTAEVTDPLAEVAEGPGGVKGYVIAAVNRAAEAIIAAEPELTRLDQQVGDGDLGVSLARAARAILARTGTLAGAADARAYFRALARIVRSATGGTSGALYSLLLQGFADTLPAGQTGVSLTAAAAGLEAGVGNVTRFGGARVGDATMVDALVPAAAALSQAVAGNRPPAAAIRALLAAADEGASSTREVVASLGRASYVGERSRGVPDPGAAAVTIWLRAALLP